MKFRPVHALFFSTLLILTALWSHQSKAQKNEAELIALSSGSVPRDEIYATQPQYLVSSSTADIGPLTNTEIMGRQLLVDYVDLATSGKASDENINDLARQYIDSVPALTRSEIVDYTSIHITSNTQENFQSYATGLIGVRNKYMENLDKFKSASEGIETTGPGLYNFATNLSSSYREAALKLRGLPVPMSIASQHIKLINSFLSSAQASLAISQTEKDPATSFSGLVTLTKNFQNEKAIFEEINKILTSNGI